MEGKKGFWKNEIIYLYPESLSRRSALEMLGGTYRLPESVDEVTRILKICPWLVGNMKGTWSYTDGRKGWANETYLLAYTPYVAVVQATFMGEPVLLAPGGDVKPESVTAGALFIRNISMREWLRGIFSGTKLAGKTNEVLAE